MAFLPALLAGAEGAGAATGAGAAATGAAEGSSLLPGALANAQKIAGLASMFQTPPIPNSNVQSSEPSLLPRRRTRMF